ncbi:MAG: methyltransferase domain-containing protein [Verrucomicrobiota bacterium]
MSGEGDETQAGFARHFYDRISKAYDLMADSSEHAYRQAGEEALGIEGGAMVLEIGFGTGSGVLELAEMVGDGGTVKGIDISEGMLEVARAKVAKVKTGATIDLQLADAQALPFEDGGFEAVFTSFTLELFPEEEIPKVLAEVKRVLKSGGKLGVVCMASVKKGEHESLLEHSYEWMHRHFPHIVDCRPINAPHFLREAGFEIVVDDERMMWTMPVGIVVGEKNDE